MQKNAAAAGAGCADGIERLAKAKVYELGLGDGASNDGSTGGHQEFWGLRLRAWGAAKGNSRAHHHPTLYVTLV